MFLPTTKQEIEELGWSQLDVILVTGDAYIDSPYIGVAVIGKVLLNAGYRVGVIAQPALNVPDDILRLGEPRLFWGVTGGSIDSMVANYTASLKKRRRDDYTPGGINDCRPDRAVIVYANLIRQYFKKTKPIVLGGIEASLRRVAHYDYWSDSIRRSILFDAKADFIAYGMSERSIVELAKSFQKGSDYRDIRGICYIAPHKPEDALELPAYEKVQNNPKAFTRMFHEFYLNNDARSDRRLCQKYTTRWLVHNPPALPLSQAELDEVYNLNYERNVHPYYAKQGPVKALETIQFAVTTHRGCYGECNFCAIGIHEGRTVQWRSPESVINEVRSFSTMPNFKGIVTDVGGPTANMYGFECPQKLKSGSCKQKRCICPEICPQLPVSHKKQMELLTKLRALPGVRKVFVASGIRHDLVLADKKWGRKYLREVIAEHTSGQMKIAPEHIVPKVLQLMGKPNHDMLINFIKLFYSYTRAVGKKQFLTYYLIAAHPGCTYQDMVKLKSFATNFMKITPEQVQIFLPAPSTYSALMYYTELNPFTGEKIFVAKSLHQKEIQKNVVTSKKEIQFQNSNK
ncbi:MAG TPA: YgiQ family radical SAM protein [Candidatus Marinimicrobia bacterium]|nr:YgiQ family radical SAM protein [Candidatus Neomarinimicrobiota bacterium]HRU92752.1 YgiQ family radical SAM protein [Candidatus Neomarinimicrobiota bacterium]